MPTPSVRLPGSKSLTARALAIAAQADHPIRIVRPLVSDDTVAFREAIAAMGASVEVRGEDWVVTGPVGRSGQQVDIWCADAGTAARFLPPLAAVGKGTYTFDASEQLRRRPIRPLLEALRELGATVRFHGPEHGFPFDIEGHGLSGGEVEVAGSQSSQFASGLLMAGPSMDVGLTVRTPGLVSVPYVDMTIALMERCGVSVTRDDTDRFAVQPGRYSTDEIRIEPDASSASYFLAAAVVTGTPITVEGLGWRSLQGDTRFARVLQELGADLDIADDSITVHGAAPPRGGTVDMGDISDTFMTLACVAPLAEEPIRIEGIGHARLKECDRIDAVARNLAACGIRVETGSDWIQVWPGEARPALIECMRDHRIAMSFSVLSLRYPGLRLDDPACVSKTFPDFHDELAGVFGGRG